MRLVICLKLCCCVGLVNVHAAPRADRTAWKNGHAESVPRPTHANVSYGDDERNVMDVWLAKSDKPTPLVFVIHGGGWRNGAKEKVDRYVDVQTLLEAGISVTAINYRYVSMARAAKVAPPVKLPMMDAARALQFVRSKAKEWNVDKNRIGGAGGSAGGCTALWLAFRDDLADPGSSDSVARESTRLKCVAVDLPQTSLDPRQMREWIPGIQYGGHAFGFKSFKDFLANRAKILPWIAEYSPYALVSKGDPPAHLTYAAAPVEGRKLTGVAAAHSAAFGVKLRERCKEKKVECKLVYPKTPEERIRITTDYFVRALLQEQSR